MDILFAQQVLTKELPIHPSYSRISQWGKLQQEQEVPININNNYIPGLVAPMNNVQMHILGKLFCSPETRIRNWSPVEVNRSQRISNIILSLICSCISVVTTNFALFLFRCFFRHRDWSWCWVWWGLVKWASISFQLSFGLHRCCLSRWVSTSILFLLYLLITISSWEILVNWC